jgi:reactive intermediate/imine deaminase
MKHVSRVTFGLTLAGLAAGLVMATVVIPAAQEGRPVIQRQNPPGLSTPTGYSHVVSAKGGRTIYVSGQVAFDAQGQIVGRGDLAAQTRQVFANLEIALKAAGATFDDVVKTNYYMLDASQVQVVREIRAKYFTRALPASTLVEVRRLANPDWLIEIEAVAVVPE